MNVRYSFKGEVNWHERAKSLAIFSAFTEGVNLFSSFAILMSFQLRNLMKGTGQIVEWSVRDESLHSKAGCWLFRTLIEENPKLKTPELEAAINEAGDDCDDENEDGDCSEEEVDAYLAECHWNIINSNGDDNFLDKDIYCFFIFTNFSESAK